MVLYSATLLIEKFICDKSSFVVTEERENRAWTESTALDREKQTQKLISTFPVTVFVCACLGCCLHISTSGQ